jgi:hypothetical protein
VVAIRDVGAEGPPLATAQTIHVGGQLLGVGVRKADHRRLASEPRDADAERRRCGGVDRIAELGQQPHDHSGPRFSGERFGQRVVAGGDALEPLGALPAGVWLGLRWQPERAVGDTRSGIERPHQRQHHDIEVGEGQLAGVVVLGLVERTVHEISRLEGALDAGEC